jgi:hypothetical protein
VPRELPIAIQNLLDTRRHTRCFFFEIAFSPIVRLTTNATDITFGEKTWYHAGGLLTVQMEDSSSQTITMDSESIAVKLTGILPLGKSIIARADYKNRHARILVGFLDDDGFLVSDPDPVFTGRCASATFNEGGQTSEIVLNIGNEWIRFEDSNGRRTNPSEHKKLYPDDSIFDNIPKMVDRTIDI